MCYVGATLHASQRLCTCFSPTLTTTTTYYSPGVASSSRSCARSRTWTSSCVSTARGGSSDLVTRRL
eukprot:scaffold91397_cov66-Phaeocystis_antarctica.AAC.2